MAEKPEVKRSAAGSKKFLERLAEGSSVGGAARAAGFDRISVFKWRAAEPEFAAAWDAAVEMGSDKIEDEALRRACDGVPKLVLHQGKPVLVPQQGYDDEGKPRGPLSPLYEEKYSDSLLVLLLTWRRSEKFKLPPRTAPAADSGSDADKPVADLDDFEIGRRITFLLAEAARKYPIDNEE